MKNDPHERQIEGGLAKECDPWHDQKQWARRRPYRLATLKDAFLRAERKERMATFLASIAILSVLAGCTSGGGLAAGACTFVQGGKAEQAKTWLEELATEVSDAEFPEISITVQDLIFTALDRSIAEEWAEKFGVGRETALTAIDQVSGSVRTAVAVLRAFCVDLRVPGAIERERDPIAGTLRLVVGGDLLILPPVTTWDRSLRDKIPACSELDDVLFDELYRGPAKAWKVTTWDRSEAAAGFWDHDDAPCFAEMGGSVYILGCEPVAPVCVPGVRP